MNDFKATVVVKLVIDVNVRGNTFEEAIKNANGLKTEDAVDVKGDFIDSKPLEVVNIWKDKEWLD